MDTAKKNVTVQSSLTVVILDTLVSGESYTVSVAVVNGTAVVGSEAFTVTTRKYLDKHCTCWCTKRVAIFFKAESGQQILNVCSEVWGTMRTAIIYRQDKRGNSDSEGFLVQPLVELLK